MKDRPPFEVVYGAALIWLVAAPIHLLGAALSKMDTEARFNAQLAVMALFCLLALVACIGAWAGQSWSRILLMIMSVLAGLAWVRVGFPWGEGSIFCLTVGLTFACIATALYFAERTPCAAGT